MTKKVNEDAPKKGRVGRKPTGKTTRYKTFCIPTYDYVNIVLRIREIIQEARRKMAPDALIYHKADPVLPKMAPQGHRTPKSSPKPKTKTEPSPKKEAKNQPTISSFLKKRQQQKNGLN